MTQPVAPCPWPHARGSVPVAPSPRTLSQPGPLWVTVQAAQAALTNSNTLGAVSGLSPHRGTPESKTGDQNLPPPRVFILFLGEVCVQEQPLLSPALVLAGGTLSLQLVSSPRLLQH